MPDRSKYPSGFDPNHFYHPAQWATEPNTQVEKVEDLASEEASYDILLCLADIRESYPTATHVYIEKDGEDGVKATTQARTEHPNTDYAAQMSRYEETKADVQKAKIAWEANKRRWDAETEAEKHTADYKVYLSLKARFERRA